MNQGIFVAAACRLEGDSEERARALAEILGLTLFETRSRVQPPAPRVLATFKDRDEATANVAAMAHAGFQPVLLASEDIETGAERVVARSFELLPDRVVLATRTDDQHEILNREVTLLLAGMTSTHEAHTETSTTRKFSFGKAVASGGMLLTSKKKVTTTVGQNEFQFFLNLYAAGHPTFVLRETELQYQGLGAALQPVRLANFRRLTEELCRRAPTAPFDNRLNTAGAQLKVLGGTLPPDRYLDVALAVLVAFYLDKQP